MKETCWNDCINSTSSLMISPDKGKANSLLDTAKGRIEFLKESKIKKENANYIFESYYTSILEILHAVALMQGFKIKNHVCIGFYIRDVISRGDLFRVFDDLRYKRNSLTYYGQKMDFDTAKMAIIGSKRLIEKIKNFI